MWTAETETERVGGGEGAAGENGFIRSRVRGTGSLACVFSDCDGTHDNHHHHHHHHFRLIVSWKFIRKAGIPEGQSPIYAGAYVTTYDNTYIAVCNRTKKKRKFTDLRLSGVGELHECRVFLVEHDLDARNITVHACTRANFFTALDRRFLYPL